MKTDKLDGTPATAIVASPEATAALIPEQTADLIEKSLKTPVSRLNSPMTVCEKSSKVCCPGGAYG